MATSVTKLDELVSVISTSVASLQAEYTRLNVPIPNLDDVNEHPLDAIHPSRSLQRAVAAIQGACTQLSVLVGSPQYIIAIRGKDYLTSTCLGIAVGIKIADHLQGHPEGLHVVTLAELTGVQPGNLARILRLLATKHIFREVFPDTFTNNRLSMQMVSSNGMSSYLGLLTDELFHSATALYDTVTDPDPNNTRIAWSRATNHLDPVWEYYKKQPGRAERFGRAMSGFNSVVTFDSTLYGFPWKSLPPGTKVCDLGGGLGHVSMHLAKACPHLYIVLQDVSHTIVQAKAFWLEQAGDVVEAQRVEFEPIDFLKESPTHGCDYFFLKNVIHNWSDKDASVIFSNIKKAMKPTSRLLIQEYVIQHVSTDNPASTQEEASHSVLKAPEPLLPNYGEGGILPYYLDIAMMSFINSKERTLEEYSELGIRNGFKLVKIWDCGKTTILEYMLPALA